MNDKVYYLLLLAVIFCLSSCSNSCGVDIDVLRGRWLQTTDIYRGSESVEVYYEFAPPEFFRIINGNGNQLPFTNHSFTIDEDLCRITWFTDLEVKQKPAYRWSDMEISEDQNMLIVDMEDLLLDTVFARDVVLTRVR